MNWECGQGRPTSGAQNHNRPRDCVRHRILWGRAGFLAFHVAPAAELAARQIWWVSTVLATASGIAPIAFGRNLWLPLLGAGVMLLPQIIRAPHLTEMSGVVPPSVASLFAGCSIAVVAASWSTRGLLCGYFWSKQAEN